MTLSRRYLIGLALVVAFGAADATTRYVRRVDGPAPVTTGASTEDLAPRFLGEPFRPGVFAAKDIDGRDVSPDTWRGKVAVVNFWATWCLPCRKEIPALVSLQERYRDRVVVIGVLDDQAPLDFVRAFSASLSINYPIVRSTSQIELSFSPVMVLPTTYVIDTAGQVVSIHGGEIDPALLEREVQALIPVVPTAFAVPSVPIVPTPFVVPFVPSVPTPFVVSLVPPVPTPFVVPFVPLVPTLFVVP